MIFVTTLTSVHAATAIMESCLPILAGLMRAFKFSYDISWIQLDRAYVVVLENIHIARLILNNTHKDSKITPVVPRTVSYDSWQHMYHIIQLITLAYCHATPVKAFLFLRNSIGYVEVTTNRIPECLLIITLIAWYFQEIYIHISITCRQKVSCGFNIYM